MVWHTGTYYWDAVDPIDAQTLIQFVESGGRLLLEGENIGRDHDSDEFMRRVAHAYQLTDGAGVDTIVATAKHPVVYSLPTFSFETMPPSPDGVEPVNNGEEVARYQGTTYSAVVVYDGLYWGFGGRVVYIAFPLHYLYESYRNTLVENAVRWLTTSYVLRVSTDRGIYLPGWTVKAVASLFDGANPLPGATVTASIYYPDGTVVSGLVMYDDGTNGDAMANDGQYTLLYDIPANCPFGYYQIEAEANIPGYVPIYRNATFRVAAAPGFSLFVEDRDIVQGIISVEIIIVVTKPDGSTFQAKVNTDSQGEFRYEFVPDALGLYRAYARFAGNNDYDSSTSDTIRFYVKMRPVIDLYALALGPRQVRLGGSVRPAPETRATIIMYVSLDTGSSWLYLCNTTTDFEGRFTIDVSMSISGELLFKAVFTGTEKLVRAETTRPLAFRLVGEEEERLSRQLEDKINELRELEKENEQLRANLTDLSNRLSEALANLRDLEENASYYKAQTEKYENEANQYRIIAIAGASISLGVGLALGTVLGRRLRGR